MTEEYRFYEVVWGDGHVTLTKASPSMIYGLAVAGGSTRADDTLSPYDVVSSRELSREEYMALSAMEKIE